VHPRHLAHHALKLLNAGTPGVLVSALSGQCLDVGAWDLPPPGQTAFRRAGGGAPMFAGDGVISVVMVIPRTVAPERILNQCCRPLLAWLKSRKIPASYGGRDALSVPDGQPVRFALTGTEAAFLVEARVAHSAGLDPLGWPAPVAVKPGDRRPSRTLVGLSRSVAPAVDDVVAELREVLQPLGPRLPDAYVAESDDVVGEAPGAVVKAPIGDVWARKDGTVVGPFHASVGLVERIRTLTLSERVREALAEPGAFVWGADAEHLAAALESA